MHHHHKHPKACRRLPTVVLVVVTGIIATLSSGCLFFQTGDFEKIKRFPRPDMKTPKHKPKVDIKCYTPDYGNAHNGDGHCWVKASKVMDRSDQFKILPEDSKDYDFKVKIIVNELSGGATHAWNWFSSILCILTATVLPAYGWETHSLEIKILEKSGREVYSYRKKFKIHVVTWMFLVFATKTYDMHHPWAEVFTTAGRIATKHLWKLLKSGKVAMPMTKPEPEPKTETNGEPKGESKEPEKKSPDTDKKPTNTDKKTAKD